jgi:inosine-uridine nucleoside N-ribohydrolase
VGHSSLGIDNAAVEFIVESAKRNPGRLTIVSLAPMHNIAEALRRYPQLAEEAVIIAMGGWMEDKNRKPERLGYNTVLGRKETQEIIKSGILIFLVNSQTVAGLYLDQQSELPIVSAPEIKSQLSRLIVGEMSNWIPHAKGTMNNVQLADPVSVILAGFPHLIKDTDPVKLEFPDAEGTMFTNASALFRVSADLGTRPNVFAVTELHQPAAIQQMIGSTLLGVTNPGLFASPYRCGALLAAKGKISGDRMIRKLLQESWGN